MITFIIRLIKLDIIMVYMGEEIMKFEEFKDNIKKEVLPFYMINGGESYLTTYTLKIIEQSLNLSFSDFNKVIFSDESNKTASDIVSACQVAPFCDLKRLIIVHDYLGKKNENEKKIFLKYFENPNETTCIVFYSSVKSEFFTSFENKANLIDCQNISSNTIKLIINDKINREGIKISDGAVNKLIEYSNNSITKIDTELDKLNSISLSRNHSLITEDDIEQNVAKDIEYVIFDLTNAICSKNSDKAYILIDTMLKNKEQPVTIISAISNYFRRLFLVSRSEFDKSYMSQMLGVKEFAITKSKEQASMFGQKKLKEIFDKCIEVEYMVKNGNMEGKNAIVFLIASILN